MLASVFSWPPQSFAGSVISTLIFGLLGIVLMVIGFKVFDWLTPRIHIQNQLAENHNIAVAIVIGAVILGVSLIIAAVLFSPVVLNPVVAQ